jgi:hypothetical protein
MRTPLWASISPSARVMSDEFQWGAAMGDTPSAERETRREIVKKAVYVVLVALVAVVVPSPGAALCDRILKGAKPADLPVVAPWGGRWDPLRDGGAREGQGQGAACVMLSRGRTGGFATPACRGVPRMARPVRVAPDAS